jgi:putative SOS response-associated peptidase YedK
MPLFALVLAVLIGSCFLFRCVVTNRATCGAFSRNNRGRLNATIQRQQERSGKSERKETYTIVTTAPSEFSAQFHDRMPCVLELKDLDQWLKDLPQEAAALMRPAKNVLQERPLGRAINNVKNNAPELLA